MPIAELFLGAFLQVLFDRLASPKLLDFARRKGIDKLLKKWDEFLKSIDQVPVDAEDRQLTGNDDRVKSWLENLRDLAYDIEDLLDEFATKSAENKSKAESSTSKAHSLLPSCCFRLSPRAIIRDHKMRSKMEEMDGRLQEIVAQKDILNLRENNGQRSAHCRLDKRLPSTHLPEPYFVSREDEKMKILRSLTGEEDNIKCADLQVIPIIGMGGVGKTALAQQIYNDAGVTSYFEKKAWVCVSDEFDVLAITKRILEATKDDSSYEGKDLNWLQDKLRENLSEKKFLVVLDDVWNEKQGPWTSLLKPLQSGAKGSKIIITTRNHRVASIATAPPIAGAPPITLQVLSLDASMTLFAFHALGVKNFDDHPNLEVLGRKIVEKCEGLPLAVKTLAGILWAEPNPRHPNTWEAILNSKIWDLSKEILPALKLSYLHLPSNLRRCFAYCAIFPKDYEIPRDELIHWWVAEGLVKEKEGKTRWNVGLDYYEELVSRSLFQKSSSDGPRFLMHDLVNELAKQVAGVTYFYSEESEEFEGDHNNASSARHASFIPSYHTVPQRLQIYHRMQRLRSFISLKNKSYCSSSVSQKVLSDLLSKLKYLRVLSLSRYRISEVPNCIGKLRHLRHLNLSFTYIKTLPKSIVALCNLEVLMLRGCAELIELSKGLEKLINLRFLDLTDTPSLRVMPLYIGNLVGLEMLSKFIVRTENGSRLKELNSLENLEGELCISDLHMVKEAKDASDANLHMKKGIRRLAMQWSKDFANFRNEELEAEVLGFLCPHQNLENLEISYYGGLQFPLWLGHPLHIDNIVHLRLHGCCRAKELPSLGHLPLLEELCIEGLNAICTVGPEFYGVENPFPSLKTLEFRDMPLWKSWSHSIGTEEVGVVFPHLEHLVIRDCPKLIGRLPSQLNSLIKLEINSCPRMGALRSIVRLPSLNELSFGGCKERVLKSLVNLTSSLTALVIEDVAGLTCLSHGFTSSLNKLQKLEMKRCKSKKLMYLWPDRDVIRNLTCLKSLVVDNCPGLLSFVPGEGDIELPSNLETIVLVNCINLEKLPSKMHTLSSLRGLTIFNCPKLVSFPETGIPTSVISLTIRDCKMLRALPMGFSVIHPEEPSSSNTRNNQADMTSCLQEIRIWGCDSLPASPFSEGRFLPATLKRLEIWRCRGVESLAEINADRLQSLQEIRIGECENLRSLPQDLHALSHLTSLTLWHCPALELECFPPLPPGISKFTLWGCPKIKALPNQLHRLPCLRELAIGECESITQFPDGGLPPQLQRLEVKGCGIMKRPVREWLTPRLTSLQFLHIDSSSIGGGVGEEEEDLVLPLPSSLLRLDIYDMRSVERLSSTLPSSLWILWIINCPKLRELPQDGHGLPPSLANLVIVGCPILEERCRKGTGCYWPLIRHIPYVGLSGNTEYITN